MQAIFLMGLFIAFLMPFALGLLLTSFVHRFRKNTYVNFLCHSISNWITLGIMLAIILPAIGWNLDEVGFRDAITPVEIGLAFLFATVSVGWFGLNAKLKILTMKRVDFKIGNWKHVAILFFSASITAAFCEEFFYRGFAITTFSSELGNIWIAGIVSSIIFALMHIPRYGFGGFAGDISICRWFKPGPRHHVRACREIAKNFKCLTPYTLIWTRLPRHVI